MEELSETQILEILKKYTATREKERHNYHSVLKHSEDFKKKNRARSARWYAKNKEAEHENYKENKEWILAKQSYKYYLKQDKLCAFKEKWPARCELLIQKNYISSFEDV